jgi:ParB-like nuclease domain
VNRKFSLDKVKANQAKVAQGLLSRDDQLRRGAPLGPLLEGRREAELPLAAILDRLAPDARPLNPGHLVTLSESISRLGLITPITVDSCSRLIAGGHRRAALRLLELPAAEREQAFRVHVDGFNAAAVGAGVPAVVLRGLIERLLRLPQRSGPAPVYLMAVDALSQPELALRIEVAENEHRRQYTRAQVLELAHRLRESGIKDTPGRPKAGERSLRPELIEVFGISRATVSRYLRAADATVADPAQPEAPRPLRFARLRRELRVALPLMTAEVAATARRLEEQLGGVAAGLSERDRRQGLLAAGPLAAGPLAAGPLAAGPLAADAAKDPLAESLQSALAAPADPPAADDIGFMPEHR